MIDDFEFHVPDEIFDDVQGINASEEDEYVPQEHDKYFISVAQHKVHSFLMIGVVSNGEKKLLARIGKYGTPHYGALSFLVMLFSSLDATLRNEQRLDQHIAMRKKQKTQSKTIHYAAYDITAEQFASFISLIKDLEKEQLAHHAPSDSLCLLPCIKKNHQTDSRSSTLTHPINHLNLYNNCRTSAIDLFNITRGQPTPRLISSLFFISPPLKSELTSKGLNKKIPFYIFPLPPNTYKIQDPEIQHILEALYQRMEDLILLNPYDKQTESKFNKLKALYEQEARNNHQDAKALVTSLQQWRQEACNRDVFALRQTYPLLDTLLDRKSKTEALFDGLCTPPTFK